MTRDEGPSLETSIFPLSFQVVREPLPRAVQRGGGTKGAICLGPQDKGGPQKYNGEK